MAFSTKGAETAARRGAISRCSAQPRNSQPQIETVYGVFGPRAQVVSRRRTLSSPGKRPILTPQEECVVARDPSGLAPHIRMFSQPPSSRRVETTASPCRLWPSFVRTVPCTRRTSGGSSSCEVAASPALVGGTALGGTSGVRQLMAYRSVVLPPAGTSPSLHCASGPAIRPG